MTDIDPIAKRLACFRYSGAQRERIAELLGIVPESSQFEHVIQDIQAAGESVLFRYYLYPRQAKSEAKHHGDLVASLVVQLRGALDAAHASGNTIESAAESELQLNGILSGESDLDQVFSTLMRTAKRPFSPPTQHDIHRPIFLREALEIYEKVSGTPATSTRDGRFASFVMATWNPVRDHAFEASQHCKDPVQAAELRKAKNINDGVSAEKVIQALRRIPTP